MIPLIIQDQSYTIQNLQRFPILQISNWSGTFFAVSYSKPALDRAVQCSVGLCVREQNQRPHLLNSGLCLQLCGTTIYYVVRPFTRRAIHKLNGKRLESRQFGMEC